MTQLLGISEKEFEMMVTMLMSLVEKVANMPVWMVNLSRVMENVRKKIIEMPEMNKSKH